MPYGGKFLIRRSVRIIPAHKKHRRSGRCPSGAAIYADEQKSLSRPIIGHTPRKLPPFRSNLPVHRIANASGCVVPVTRVPIYNIGKPSRCQAVFFYFVHKICLKFSVVLTDADIVPPGRAHSPIWWRGISSNLWRKSTGT